MTQVKGKSNTANTSGYPRMTEREFQRIKVECEEQKNYQASRQLRNDVEIEKLKADASDIKVQIQGNQYLVATHQLAASQIDVEIEASRTDIKKIDLADTQNQRWLKSVESDLSLQKGIERLRGVSLEVDAFIFGNETKRQALDVIGAEVTERVNGKNPKRTLEGL